MNYVYRVKNMKNKTLRCSSKPPQQALQQPLKWRKETILLQLLHRRYPTELLVHRKCWYRWLLRRRRRCCCYHCLSFVKNHHCLNLLSKSQMQSLALLRLSLSLSQ